MSERMRQLFQKYSPSIVCISSTDDKGDWNTATGFHIGDGYLVTARHVIEGRSRHHIKPYRYAADTVTALSTFTPSDPRIDLAVIKSDFSLVHYMTNVTIVSDPPVEMIDHIPLGGHLDDWIGDELMLSETMLMGYPPVPTSIDPVLVAYSGQVNAIVDRYIAPHPHFIVSGTARGGFSGGPVISEYDFLLGVATASLTRDSTSVESGFIAAISVEPLFHLLRDNGIYPGANGALMRELGF